MSRAMTRRFFRLCGTSPCDDAQGQPLDDRRLADARLADEHGVVLRAAREDLDHAADFVVAADDRIELAGEGLLHQVDAVFLQGLILAFGVLVGDARAAADRFERFENVLVADAVDLQQVLGRRVVLRQGQQQMLDRDELVLHRGRFLERRFEHRHELAIGLRLRAAADLRLAVQLGLHLLLQLRHVDADFFQDRPGHAVLLVEQRRQQVQRVHLRMALVRGQRLGALDGFLRFDREFVEAEGHGFQFSVASFRFSVGREAR